MTLIDRVALGVASITLIALLGGCGEPTEQQLIASAKASLTKHELRTAAIQLKSALATNPSSPEARFLLGTTLLEAGDLVTAEVELRKAKDLHYPPAQWAPALARAMLRQLQIKQVLQEFSAMALPDAASQADLSASVAAALAVDGQSEPARALVDKTLSTSPQHAATLMLKARLLARPGTLDQAVALLEDVITRDAGNVDALQLLGDLHLQGNRDVTKAAAAYNKVLALRPADVTAHSSLVYVRLVTKDLAAARQQLDAMAKVLPGHAQTRFLTARIAFLSGDLQQAREQVQTLLGASPNSTSLLEFAGAVELALNAPVKAEAYLSKALAQNPNLPPVRRLLADVYMRGGKPAKAIEILRPNIDRPVPDVASLSLVAEAHMQSGDLKKAEAMFQQAASLAPQDTKYKTALALTMLAKGQAEPAFTELRSIAQSASDSLPDLSLISALLRRQKLDEALQAIDVLERKQPDKPIAANLRGRVQLARRDLTAARTSFEQALAKDPKFLPAISSLAAIDLAEGKPEVAEKRYLSMISADPKNAQAYISLAQLKARAGADKGQIGKLLEQAVQANINEPASRLLLIHHWLSIRDLKSALAAAQAGVAAMPSNPEMLDALGSMQLATGESNQAIATFNRVASLQPASVKAQLRLADAYLQGKDYASAERSFKRALEIDPNDLSAQRGLIAMSVRAKQPERALEVARMIQRQKPEDAIGFLIEGDIQLGFKNSDAAIKAYRSGLERPNSGKLAERLYQALATKSKAEATRFADDWIKRQPKDVVFQIFMGNNAMSDNELPVADRYFSEIIKNNRGNVLALNNLAWVRAKLGKGGAVSLAEEAAALVPEDPAILDTLAFALAAENKLPKAIETGKTVIVLAPDEPVYRLNLAKLYIQNGEKANAKTELERLAPLGAKFARQAEVTELLKGLP